MINSDIFREYDIRGIVDRDLTAKSVGLLGKGIGTYLLGRGIKHAVVGRDCRLSSLGFAQSLNAGLTATGIEVVDVGMVATPELYFSMFHYDIDGGVMITGSHNPPDFNGFKVCADKASIFGDGIRKIYEIIKKGDFAQGSGKIHERDVQPAYQKYLIGNARMGKRRLKVVLDAGNGTACMSAMPVFERLGIDVTGLYCKPDGRFPNHHPDPTIMKNLAELQNKVVEEKADLGIAFDGDGDRIGVVDEQGRPIFGDRLLLVLARALLKKRPGAEIVAEVKCSQVLFDQVEKAGGKALMWKVGHSLIKAKMTQDNALLGGEMSGHIFFRHRYLGFDDATYAALRLMEIMSSNDGTMSSLLADIPRTSTTPEIRVACPDNIKFDVVRRAVERFKQDYTVIDVDGARVKFKHGWGLVRPSNTQPVLVYRFEADSQQELEKIKTLMMDRVNEIVKEVDNG